MSMSMSMPMSMAMSESMASGTATSMSPTMTMAGMSSMSDMPMAGMPMGSSTSGMMDMPSGLMNMVFTTGVNTSLYSMAFTPTTTGQYAGACIFLIVLAVIFRGLVAFRIRIFDILTVVKYGQGAGRVYAPSTEKRSARRWKAGESIMLATVDVVLAGVGYLLMLAVMTLNVGYFLSVLAGLFVGSVIFNHFMSTSAAPWQYSTCG